MDKQLQSIKDLEEKAWYRFLKVVYIGLFSILILFILLFIVASPQDVLVGIVGLGILLFLAYLIRGAFYYIILGRFNPKEKE